MPRERQFLVRGPDGKMHTVVSTSLRSAGELYRARERPAKGSKISIKERGVGKWADFKVTR